MLHLQKDWYLKGATKEKQATSKLNLHSLGVGTQLNVQCIRKKSEMETNWLSSAMVLQRGVRWVLIHNIKLFINSVKLILLDRCDPLMFYFFAAVTQALLGVFPFELMRVMVCMCVHALM